MDKIKQTIGESIVAHLGLTLSPSDARKFCQSFSPPKLAERGDLAIPLSRLAKLKLGGFSPKNFRYLAGDLKEFLESLDIVDHVEFIDNIDSGKESYLNLFLSIQFLGKIIPQILDGNYLEQKQESEETTIIEYSQPNTHKAFHVGHLRNMAIGNALVRIYRHAGNKTVACNYFGDDGAHVAKCLWLLEQELMQEQIVPPSEGISSCEYLGDYYTRANYLLDLKNLTTYPFPEFFTVKVDKDTPAKLSDPNPTYKVGDIIAVKSCEILRNRSSEVITFPEGTPLGVEVMELGRLPAGCVPEDQTVSECYKKRKEQVSEVLRDLRTKWIWKGTRDWCLDEFREIYKWFGCNFDFDFFESELGEESEKYVRELHAAKAPGIVESNGIICADLSAHKLPFLPLLKSDGNGLYATKDLLLAQKKITQFAAAKSIYVVDSSQKTYFEQVFKTLEMIGYKNASKCFHLSYGQVRLQNGKMSSRLGNTVSLSSVKRVLEDEFKVSEESKRILVLATLKYGMLKVDPSKDIIFDKESWTSKTGNSGIYLLYAYARTQSIKDKVAPPSEGKYDAELFTENTYEKQLLLKFHLFWEVVFSSAEQNKPNLLCNYLFSIAQLYMSWYSEAPVKTCSDLSLQYSRLLLNNAVGKILRVGCSLLGIETLQNF